MSLLTIKVIAEREMNIAFNATKPKLIARPLLFNDSLRSEIERILTSNKIIKNIMINYLAVYVL